MKKSVERPNAAATAGDVSGMRQLRIGFLARSFSPHTRSYIPLVIRALEELGAVVDVINPAAGVTDLSDVRVEHDLYVLKQQSGLPSASPEPCTPRALRS